MKMRSIKIIVFLLVFVHFSYGQLSSFSLSVSKTDETCTGNGSLTFSTNNTTSGSTIIYSVYLFPNLTNPLAVLTTNTLTGLSAGTYRVVALQSLGNESNSQQQDIQIDNLISPLSYQLTSIPQSCQSNGSITVNVTQGNPQTFEILSGPIIVPPQSSNVFANLPVGVYNIRVNDVCGDGLVQTYTLVSVPPEPNLSIIPFSPNCKLVDCNTSSGTYSILAEETTTISYPLTVVFTVFPPVGAPIVSTQTIQSGDSSTLQIVTNVPYYNNQTWYYKISVTDACGNVVTTNNITVNQQTSLTLSLQSPNSCYKQIILNLCNYVAPYTVEFISAPAGFNPVLFNSSHPGPFTLETSYVSNDSNDLPEGEYVIQVTDACGRVVQDKINVVNSQTDYIVSNVLCSNVVNIPYAGVPIETVILTAAPGGFPGTLPIDLSSDIVGGYFQMELPLPGIYEFMGINICGDPYHLIVEIPFPSVSAVAIPGGSCNNGRIDLEIFGGPRLLNVTMIQAPSVYPATIPYDISNLIIAPDDIKLSINDIYVGDYVFYVEDTCGNFYTVSVTMPESQAPIIIEFLKGCTDGFSSIKLSSISEQFVSVIITAAPPEFNQTLPYDVSANIATNGIFYMNSLPQGNYTFHTNDICNLELDTTIQIEGYLTTQNGITIQENCGSFNVSMQHLVNEYRFHTYWLQKFNPITNQWEHPFTGVAYVDNSPPTATNSFLLTNFQTNYNLVTTGVFRILKFHYVFSSGFIPLTNCIETIKEFEFYGDLRIISAYTFPCSNGSNEVLIVANGVPPLNYKITSRNGLPFEVNNGTSNIFSGLTPAIYNFQVQDQCGNIVNRLFDITSLPEPSIVADNLCDGQVGQLSVQAISYLNYQWWKSTDPSTILSTTNVLTFNPFSSTTTPGTYFVRMYSTAPVSCADKTISYNVPAISNPNAGENNEVIICDTNAPINLFSLLVPPFDSTGVWSETTNSGMLNGNIWLPIGVPYGTYVFHYTVTGFCDQMDQAIITIVLNQGPSVPVVSGVTEICEGDSISFSVENSSNTTFQWSGPNNFSSSNQNIVIENCTATNAGNYQVTAFLNGCQKTSVINVTIKPKPNYTIDSRCENGLFTVTVIPIENSFNTDLVTYNWSGPNNFSSTLNPIILSGYPIGIYSVSVTNPDDCSNNQSVDIVSTLCSIPNIITPNNDGSNDSFDLSGFEIDKFEIYSRWGRLVYEEHNYINSWHGQNMNNEPLPDSTYYYIISLQSGEKKHGWVFVAR
jgi:gliding motility-associated-like protein